MTGTKPYVLRMSPRGAKDYWPELDGLRALSALAVLLYHSRPLPVGRQGFVGVDVFFVLSGFLITRLLLIEHASDGTIRLRRFFARRALRLYPALVAVCGFTAALSLVYRDRAEALLAAAATAATYTSNVWILSGRDALVLAHTWTLALEAQFYLVWPVIVLVALSWRRRMTLWLATLGLALLVFFPAGGSFGWVQKSYGYALGLAVGCAVAFYLDRRPDGWRPGRGWRAAAGAGAVGLAITALGPGALPTAWFDGWFRLASLMAAPLVLVVVSGPVPRPWRALATPPLVWLGHRSYSFYLWHLPVVHGVADVARGTPSALRLLIAGPVSVAVAALSYRFVERPFLRRKHRLHATPANAEIAEVPAPSELSSTGSLSRA